MRQLRTGASPKLGFQDANKFCRQLTAPLPLVSLMTNTGRLTRQILTNKKAASKAGKNELVKQERKVTAHFYPRDVWPKGDGTKVIQIRIRIDGKENGGFSSLPPSLGGQCIRIATKRWDQRHQKLTDDSEESAEINRKLVCIRERIIAIFRDQIERGLLPTRTSVRQEFQADSVPASLQPNENPEELIGAYNCYVKHLKAMQHTEQGVAKSTIQKWKYCLKHLTDFLESINQPDLKAAAVTAGIAKRYYNYLLSSRGMKAGSACRYAKMLGNVLAYQVEEDNLPYNPLVGLKLSRGKGKEVYSLENVHQERFWQLNGLALSDDERSVWWWSGVMLLTGLDYADAIRYVSDRQRYEVEGKVGVRIVINRGKTKVESHIPLQEALANHLALNVPKKRLQLNHLNRILKQLGVRVGFNLTLTSKILRKTAGMLFLQQYSIKAVSRILGHSTIAMTEKYYVKVTGDDVDRETARINQADQLL